MQLTNDQFALIKQQFATLKERSAFYAAKFDGIDLTDVQTQEDFEKLPFSEKDDLRNAYPLGLQAVPDEEIVRIHSSSGTTGTPIITWYSLDVPSVAAMTSSTWAGKMLQPFTLNMSSVRPVSVSMRGWRWPKPHVQSPGMMRVRSCVR